MVQKPHGGSESAGDETPADFELPRTRPSDVLDGFVLAVGRLVSWIWVALVLVIVYNVVQRYVFSVGSILLEELQWHFYAVGFMIGLSYALTRDRHVRVDVVAERWRPKTRAWAEFLGLTLLLLPFSVSILIESVPYIITSYNFDESSSAPGGMPNLWILKSFIFWGFGMLVIAAFSRLMRVTALLFGFPRPIWRQI